MTAIKHIIFDLGGVFLNINFQLTSQAFAKLGVTDSNNMFTQHYSNPLFELLETGKITEHEFNDAYRDATKVDITNQEIKDAWNALLLDFPPERILWLEQMAKSTTCICSLIPTKYTTTVLCNNLNRCLMAKTSMTIS